MNVLVIGYYNHCNLGDEQYKHSIKYILTNLPDKKPKSVSFLDCDKLDDYTVPDDTVIILGGGDVLNNYFLDKMNKKFGELSPKPRIIAFSVGIPYNSIFLEKENLKKLEIFDHIYLRTKQDIPVFSEYFDKKKLSYLPDASCYLEDAYPPVSLPVVSKNEMYKKLYGAVSHLHKTKKIINVNLCRHIHHKDEPYKQNYNSIVRELAAFLEELTRFGYYLIFLPFNTKSTSPGSSHDSNNENDILIAGDVLKHMKNHTNILNIDFELSLPEILSLYPFFYISIPMRFHGTLFSVNAAVPMIPLYTTKKIRNFLLDIGWNYEYMFEKNNKDLPIHFDSKKMMTLFLDCVKNRRQGEALLKEQNQHFKQYYNEEKKSFQSILFDPTEIILDIIPPPQEHGEVSDGFDSFFSPLDENKEVNVVELIFNKLQRFAGENGKADFRELTDPTQKNVAVCVVSYFLTGLIDSQYSHGLMDKMFSPLYEYKKEWKWVLGHYKPKETLPENSEGFFNISYIDQNDRSGAHRSGWKYVFDNLAPLNSSNAPILLDLYLDRTFHWKREIFKHLGIIPYVKPWVGFVHHTFDTTFSEYNSHGLLDCPEFIDSLPSCKGIIVLSEYLKTQFENELNTRGIINKPTIVMLTHPTETNVPMFSIDAFLNNPDKKIIHIGGWLRNIFSFYQLSLDKNVILNKSQLIETQKTMTMTNFCSFWRTIKENPPTFETTIRKAALKGKYMDNYYPSKDFSEKLYNSLTNRNNDQEKDAKFCSHGGITNNWVKHMIDHLDNISKKMDIISVVDNKTYDELLTENLVFINLVDGSAVNTLIECVVRNTPIFINRHPAVIEILGENYPLLYDDVSDVNSLLRNPNCIEKAHNYMKKIDKTPYTIDEFMKNLQLIGKKQ